MVSGIWSIRFADWGKGMIVDEGPRGGCAAEDDRDVVSYERLFLFFIKNNVKCLNNEPGPISA